MQRMNAKNSRGFTLVELLAVIGIIGAVAGLLFPAIAMAKRKGQRIACLSNERQIGVAATLYMADNDGSMFHHHEGWVLDDGTQVAMLPTSLSEVNGGGMGNSQAEKPWAILLQPYLNSRKISFCPGDGTSRSQKLAQTLEDYNGGVATVTAELPGNCELSLSQSKRLTMESYLLNSIFTHRSARYALEGAIRGFATEAAINALPDPNVIMFSERNSEALNAADNVEFGSVAQDDYDTWVGEGALIQWGEGKYAEQGWIKHDRHEGNAQYVYTDGHVENLSWRKARRDQFPDHIVRKPVASFK